MDEQWVQRVVAELGGVTATDETELVSAFSRHIIKMDPVAAARILIRVLAVIEEALPGLAMMQVTAALNRLADDVVLGTVAAGLYIVAAEDEYQEA